MTDQLDIRDSLRISDTERERYAGHLSKMAGEGRLEPGEHEARVAAIWKAKTIADLAGLTKDLPAMPGSQGAQRALARQQRLMARRERLAQGSWALWRLGVTGMVFLFFVAINLIVTIPVILDKTARKGPAWSLPRDLAMGVSATAGIALIPLMVILGIFLHDTSKERRQAARTGGGR